MKSIAVLAALPLVLAVVALSVSSDDKGAAGATDGKTYVNGVVLDRDKKPIAGAEVALLVTGKNDSVAGIKSERNTGAYRFAVVLTGAFDISFTKAGYHPCVSKQLVEGHEHKISVVLYKRGERMSSSAAHDYLQSVDRLVFLMTAINRAGRDQFAKQFELMAETESLARPLPVLIEGSNKEVTALLADEQAGVRKRLVQVVPGAK